MQNVIEAQSSSVHFFVPSSHRPNHRLVLDVAALQARLDTLGERGGQEVLVVAEVLGADLRGHAEGSVDDISLGEAEEVLGNGAGTGVLRVETGDTNGRLAVLVLLPVDGTLGEDGTLPDAELSGELVSKAVLENEASGHVGLGGEGEVLGCARVDVRGVETAGLEEDGGRGDSQASKNREVSTVGKINLSTLARSDVGVGSRVVVEDEAQGTVIEVLLEVGEAGDDGVGSEELTNSARRGNWVGRGIGVTKDAGLSGLAGSGLGAGRRRRSGGPLAIGSTTARSSAAGSTAVVAGGANRRDLASGSGSIGWLRVAGHQRGGGSSRGREKSDKAGGVHFDWLIGWLRWY